MSEIEKEYSRRYREKHHDEILERARIFRSNNKGKIKKYSKKYYDKSKDKYSAYGKKYREEHKEQEKARLHKYFLENKDKVLSRNKKYTIENMEKVKARQKKYDIEHLKEKQEYRKKYNILHKEKRNKQIAEWQKTHKEQIRNNKREWRHTPRGRSLSLASDYERRARLKKTSDGSAEKWMAEKLLLEQQGQTFICEYCKKEFIMKGNRNFEHKIALDNGGPNIRSNLCISCPPCNNQKYLKSPAEWDEYRVKYLGHVLEEKPANGL